MHDPTPTAEFAAFLVARRALPVREYEMQADGFVYRLRDGCLAVCDVGDAREEYWCSSAQWWVEDFRIGDIGGTGQRDFLFTLWKSWSFGGPLPHGVTTDSPEVRCHLFCYTMRLWEGRPVAKALWCSSNLPRPLLAFELDPSGRRTPVSSGMLLRTHEGSYCVEPPHGAGAGLEDSREHHYAWQGWGFVEL